MISLLRTQEEELRLAKSLGILDKLFMMKEFQSSSTVLFYASFDGEVDTFEIMKRAQKIGKKIGLPAFTGSRKEINPTLVEYLENLKEGAYGIKQPVQEESKRLDPAQIDMVVVPGIAFDKKNNRLGRGGGYYDRFLCDLSSHIPTIGLAFDFQIVDLLPQQEEHDIAVSHVLVN